MNKLFEFQDTHQERIIHSRTWKHAWYRLVLEGAGDIFRELTKDYICPNYIYEKIKRIEQHFKLMEIQGYPETGIHPDDSLQTTYKANKKEMDLLLKFWEEQPVETEIQDVARKLNIALITGDYDLAKDCVKVIKAEFDL